MQKNYYISRQPFFFGSNVKEVWPFLISTITEISNPKIRIIEDIEEDELLLDNNVLNRNHFISEKPTKVFLSQKPYIVKESSCYLCYEYKLTNTILKQLQNEWFTELFETFAIKCFTINDEKTLHFAVNFHAVIALLGSNSRVLKFYTANGVNFKLWNIALNDTI